MTEAEKITMVKAMSGETDTNVISAYLYMAGKKVIRYAYPYNDTITEVPDKYAHIQIDATVYMLNKRGAEGEVSHTENGIGRGYESADLPTSMLREIVPICGVGS